MTEQIKEAEVMGAIQKYGESGTELVHNDKQPLAPLNMKELVEYQVSQLISLAGTIELTTEQREILYSKVKDEEVEIRPDGLIYLPWMEYVSRLHRAFGMEWAIVPHGKPELNPNRTGILWPFFLIVKGKPMGYAIGEQEYFANNEKMTWGDACEGAKSNALMRLCKGIGISLDLWRPSFIKEWKRKYTETYPDPRGKVDQWGKIKKLWRKKEAISEDEGAGAGADYRDTPGRREPADSAANVRSDEPKAPAPSKAAPKRTGTIKDGRYTDDEYPPDIDLTLPDGTKVRCSRYKAYDLFENMKKAIGESRYHAVLGSMGYEKKSDVPTEELHLVYAMLAGEWNKLRKTPK